jgi:hypothetical protein
MPVQATQMYNSGYNALMAGGESPSDTTPGEFYWVLVSNDYTPSITHSTGADFGGNEITAGDGVPKAATLVAISTTGSEAFFQTANVSIGPDTTGGTITYRYLALVRTGGVTYSTSADLIFYIDLLGADTESTTAINESVNVNMTNSGWFKMVQS